MKLALTQYLSYLIAGALYYLMIAAFMAVAAGFSLMGLGLLFLPLLLGGYASGLSFFAPRAAAAAAGILALPFLALGVSSALTGFGRRQPSADRGTRGRGLRCLSLRPALERAASVAAPEI